MNQMEIRKFTLELLNKTASWRKGNYVPTFIMERELSAAWAQEYEFDDDIPAIAEQIAAEGITMVSMDEEEYAPKGSSDRDLEIKFLEIINKEDVDIDFMYYLGTEEFAKRYKDLFIKLTNCAFFADKNEMNSLETSLRTHYLLGEALSAYHCELHPEDAERSQGWVDEEVQKEIQENTKDGYFPSSVTEKIIQDLMIEYGEYPLCINILKKSASELNAKSIAVLKEVRIPHTSDKELLKDHIKKVMNKLNVDLEKCYKESISSISTDAMQIITNHYFFADNDQTVFADAGFKTGAILTEIINEAHQDMFPDEDKHSPSRDEKFEVEVKTYAKNGFVPSWVIVENVLRLQKEYGNVGIPGQIRDDILERYSLKMVLVDKEEYLPEGTKWDTIAEHIMDIVSNWDLDEFYEKCEIPEKHTTAHNHLIGIMYFGCKDIEAIEDAEDDVLDIELRICAIDHLKKHPHEIPDDAWDAVDEIVIDKYVKNSILPSFIRDSVKEALMEYVSNRWYAGWLYDRHIKEKNIEEISVHEDDYIEPCQSSTEAINRLTDIIKNTDIDIDYIHEHRNISEADVDLVTLLVNILFFADPTIETIEQAENGIAKILLRL